jgi:N-acetylglucosamine-6-phosphate deacetylase
MNDAVSNVIRTAGVTLRDAVEMATVNPARIVHLDGRSKGLVPGDRADLVLFRFGHGVEVEHVYLDGELTGEQAA